MRGQITQTSDVITYSSVVIRQTVCIALTMVAIHDLEVKAADVSNAYVMANSSDKIWTTLGSEFENDVGKSAIFVRILHCLKRVNVAFRAHLSEFIDSVGYNSCKEGS